MRVLVLCLLGSTIVRGTVLAQTPEAAARAVSAAFFKAMEAADWKAAAGFLDLGTLERERQSAVEGARRQRTMPPMTVERLMRMDPEMPRTVAEYQIKRMNESRHSGSYLEHEFGVADPDSLVALPVEVVAQHWLEAHDQRVIYREAMRSSRTCSLVANDSGPAPEYHIMGTVVDDTMAYTLFRQGDRGMPDAPYAIFPPKVLQLRQDRSGWWVIPSSEITSFRGMAIQCERVSPKKPGGA